LFAAASLCFIAGAQAGGPGSVAPYVLAPEVELVGEIIVKPRGARKRGPLSATELAALSRAAGVQLGYVRELSGGAHLLSLGYSTTKEDAAAICTRLEDSRKAEYATPNALERIQQTPNDTFYPQQWHYHSPAGEGLPPQGLNLPPAWDLETGSGQIVVAVIDTGHLPHVDLEDRRIAGYDMITDNFIDGPDGTAGRDADSTDVGDFVSAGQCFVGSPARNSSWHGTHVAGTIGAETNAMAAQGVAGVNWASPIQHVRALGKCGGTGADINDSIRWAAGLEVPGAPINPTPARVINMSLGGAGKCDKARASAIGDATKAGVVIVVAAGNDTAPAANFSPASCKGVITVAASKRDGGRAYYSNFGKPVLLAAPGGETNSGPPDFTSTSSDGVASTLDLGTSTALNDNQYVYYQGTSMAAPHVSGLVSLLLSRHPSLTPKQVTSILKKGVRAFPEVAVRPCSTKTCGAGIADAQLTLTQVEEQPEPGLDCGPAPVSCTGAAFPSGYVKGRFSYIDPSKNLLTVEQAGASLGNFDFFGHPHENAGEHAATCLYRDGTLLLKNRVAAMEVNIEGASLWAHKQGKGTNVYAANPPNIDGVSSLSQVRGANADSKIVTKSKGGNLRAKPLVLVPDDSFTLTVQHHAKGGGASNCFQTVFGSASIEFEKDSFLLSAN
jgi:serine protease